VDFGWLAASALPLLLVGALVLLVALAIRWAKRQQKQFLALVAAHGWSYQERDDGTLVRRYQGLEAVPALDTYLRDVVTGTHDGMPFVAFHVRAANAGSAQERQPRPMAVVATPGPPGSPDLIIAEKLPWANAAQAALGGTAEIAFESRAFTERFWVRSTDRRFAYEVVHPRLMEWLLRRDRNHGRWELRGPWIAHYNLGAFTGDHLVTAVQELREFVQLLPPALAAAPSPPGAA